MIIPLPDNLREEAGVFSVRENTPIVDSLPEVILALVNEAIIPVEGVIEFVTKAFIGIDIQQGVVEESPPRHCVTDRAADSNAHQ